jgi:imidazolonepropionase-like amidohydrolase
VRPPASFAVASGYAPVIGQELLVRAWIARGRPAKLALLPDGDVAIQSRGQESFVRDGKPVSLEHIAIFGLVWGREDLWIDDKQQLAALVTRDLEFDHFEAMRSENVGLIDEFVARAGNDAVAWLGEAAQKGALPSGALALVGARLVDGTGAPPIEDATVVVDGDRIVAAGPRASTAVPAGARTIDVRGASIVPGLWDMHAHVEQVEQAAAYLAAGVTTVRDEGNILPFITALRDAVDGGRGVGPRVIVDCLVDSDDKMALGTLRVNSTDDIVPLVDRAVKAGCAEIKIYSSLKPPLVAPLCAEAHRRGLRVTGHIPTGMDINDALDAGFDGVNHLQYVWSPLFPKKKEENEKMSRVERRRRLLALDFTSEPMQKLFARMAAQKTAYDPTVALFELFLHPAAELARREPGFAKMPRELRGSYGVGMDPADVADDHRIFEKYLAALREMHKRGVTIVAGTDIGVPGHSLDREIELYVEAGFSPLEALQAATIVPARLLGRDRELGSVTVGKRADLVVVDGNPLADIHALRKVRLVVARGRAYDPATMWKIAGFQP